jgi:hypothetical protein
LNPVASPVTHGRSARRSRWRPLPTMRQTASAGPRPAAAVGAPDDIDTLKHRIVGLEQQVADLRGQLADQGDELAAARGANRELMVQLNAGTSGSS